MANVSPTRQAFFFSKKTVLLVATATLWCPIPPASSEQQKTDVLHDTLVGAFFAFGHAKSITVTEHGDLCSCKMSPFTIGTFLFTFTVAHRGAAFGISGAGGQNEYASIAATGFLGDAGHPPKHGTLA